MITTLLSNPLLLVVYVVSLFLAIGLHEYAHAKAADQLGDPTPRLQGRLSLNPFVHIDLLGLAFLFFFGFGWGKPVGFDPYNLKNPRRDAAIISFAGPLSNILLAVIASILLRVLDVVQPEISSIFFLFLSPFISLNILLALFNLIPIHPLDGFKIVGGLLPKERAQEWYGLQRYGIIFLLLLIFPIGRASMAQTILQPVMSFILGILLPLR